MFTEIFQYKNVTTSELQKSHLEVSVLDRKVIYPKKQSLIGKVLIDLKILKISNVEETEWYPIIK